MFICIYSTFVSFHQVLYCRMGHSRVEALWVMTWCCEVMSEALWVRTHDSWETILYVSWCYVSSRGHQGLTLLLLWMLWRDFSSEPELKHIRSCWMCSWNVCFVAVVLVCAETLFYWSGAATEPTPLYKSTLKQVKVVHWDSLVKCKVKSEVVMWAHTRSVSDDYYCRLFNMSF